MQDSHQLDIRRDTTWQEVFGTLSISEQTCIREEIGERSFGSVMAQPILEYLDSDIEDMDAGLRVFQCIPDVFVTAMAQQMGADPEEMSHEEKSCLQDWARGIDPVALAAEDNEAAAIGVGFGILACVPGLFAAVTGEDEGLETFEIYSDSARVRTDAFENAIPATVGEAIGGGIEDRNEVDYFVFQAEAGLVYQIDVTPVTMSDPTLELLDSNLESLDYNDDYDGLAPRIQWTAPRSGTYYVAVGGYDDGVYLLTIAVGGDVLDDHADWPEEATVATVDEPIGGAIEDLSDVDFFVFQTEEGVTYQIDVAGLTLTDPTVELFDANSESLDYSDDEIGFAPRIQWEAPSSGTNYVAVEGYDLGTYTLTIATR